MKILEKTTTPTGIKIVLEDWSDKNTKEFSNLYGLQIHAYPIQKRFGKWQRGYYEPNSRFLILIAMNQYVGYTNDDIKADFEALKSGDKSLEDLANYFWNGEKDMWLLGMDVEYKGW